MHNSLGAQSFLKKNLSSGPFIIAEIGVNHEGSVEKALQLIALAKAGGADAVKFQSYTPERFISASLPDRLVRVKSFALSEDEHKTIADFARSLDIHFLSTPVTEDWVPLLNTLCDALKIASGDIDFEPVIRAAARTGKPFIISTGNAEEFEIDRAVSWVADEIGEAYRDQLVLMHCVSAYPVPVEQANINSILHLKERYSCKIGYSNHVIGPSACLAATALGADVIEVHFTDQKEGRSFRDHSLSFDVKDLTLFTKQVKEIKASLGRKEKRLLPCERESQRAMRKGLIASRDLVAGETLKPTDVMFARPATHYFSQEVHEVVGKTIKTNLRRGELIKQADL